MAVSNIIADLSPACAVALIGGVLWFFSNRPRTCVRFFVPREHLREAIRAIHRDRNWGRGMRWFSAALLLLAVLMVLASLVMRGTG
jgi:hypothetical protein